MRAGPASDAEFPHTVPLLLATGIILLWYTHETRLIRKTNAEQTGFSALTRVHSALSNTRTYELRRVLHESFVAEWARALKAIAGDGNPLGRLVTSEGEIQIAALSDLPTARTREMEAALRTLRSELDQWSSWAKANGVAPRPSVLAAVEETLLAFDVIALPVKCKMEGGHIALEAYGPLLDGTASYLLPFVAVMMYLRAQPRYKRPYLQALEELRKREWLPSLDDKGSELLSAALEAGSKPR